MKKKLTFLTVFALVCIAFLTSCSKDEADDAVVIPEENIGLKATCQTSSIHYGDYWLNNNTWGSYNDGFGTQCVWLTNQNSWGANCTHTGSNSSGIKGYPSMVYGTQGSVSTTTTLPKKISKLGNAHTWWAWSASGRAWNAVYDIWFNDSSYELMIWMQWQNSWPMGNSLGAVATNVTISGYKWNVYKKNNVYSFLLVNQQGWISMDIKPFITYCVSKGWIPSTATLYRIEAGWEVIDGGTFKTNSFGISQI
jgi:hypothetical protein